jgi:hypothetical protein
MAGSQWTYEDEAPRNDEQVLCQQIDVELLVGLPERSPSLSCWGAGGFGHLVLPFSGWLGSPGLLFRGAVLESSGDRRDAPGRARCAYSDQGTVSVYWADFSTESEHSRVLLEAVATV